jgi:putative addiction module killer protein
MKYRVHLYLEDVRSPYLEWFESLDAVTQAKIHKAIVRLEFGNTGNCKHLREGTWELKVDYGPGYRIYYGLDGVQLVILLGGGSKRKQSRDIQDAVRRWKEFNIRKKADHAPHKIV